MVFTGLLSLCSFDSNGISALVKMLPLVEEFAQVCEAIKLV